ncbi:MAG: competence/damage-inducible protein A [Myxococcota bacterium]
MKRIAETAAALVIGNELLSGKIQEANLIELARALRALGIRLIRAVFVPDDIDVIANSVRELRTLADVVFTSGGVGPTHDDVTVEAIARAFGVEAVIEPTLAALLREVYGERCTDAHLRMALVPQGAELVSNADVRWPTPLIGNVYVLPGVPEIFRMRLDAVRSHLTGPRPLISKAVFLALDEPELTPTLNSVVAAHPEVEIGSYPKWFDKSYKTKVTFDGSDEQAVARAVSAFVAHFRDDQVVRFE